MAMVCAGTFLPLYMIYNFRVLIDTVRFIPILILTIGIKKIAKRISNQSMLTWAHITWFAHQSITSFQTLPPLDFLDLNYIAPMAETCSLPFSWLPAQILLVTWALWIDLSQVGELGPWNGVSAYFSSLFLVVSVWILRLMMIAKTKNRNFHRFSCVSSNVFSGIRCYGKKHSCSESMFSFW